MLVNRWRKGNTSTLGEYKLEQPLWKIVENFFQKLKKKKKKKKTRKFNNSTSDIHLKKNDYF